MPDREPLHTVTSEIIALPEAHIDTDQIIPARFLTTTARDGLGQYAFFDRREQPPFTDPRATTARILVAGDNFGCGSSREHAAWALADFGIRVVISSEIADIFRTNAMKNGILPIQLEDEAVHRALLATPWRTVTVDLPARRLTAAACDGHDAIDVRFEVDAFAAHCLTQGIDELDFLVASIPQTERFERETGR